MTPQDLGSGKKHLDFRIAKDKIGSIMEEVDVDASTQDHRLVAKAMVTTTITAVEASIMEIGMVTEQETITHIL